MNIFRAGSKRHNDPNHADDPEYIVRLLGHVRLEAVKVVNSLPGLDWQ